jgi:hypothetical protein
MPQLLDSITSALEDWITRFRVGHQERFLQRCRRPNVMDTLITAAMKPERRCASPFH